MNRIFLVAIFLILVSTSVSAEKILRTSNEDSHKSYYIECSNSQHVTINYFYDTDNYHSSGHISKDINIAINKACLRANNNSKESTTKSLYPTDVHFSKKVNNIITELNNHTVKNDGTVIDNDRNLMWMRCSIGQKITKNGCEGNPNYVPIKMLNNIKNSYNNQKYLGYDDWRTPTIYELMTLIYCSSGKVQSFSDKTFYCDGKYNKPTIDSKAFTNINHRFYLSSSEVNDRWGGNYAVDFELGGLAIITPTNSESAVILVRDNK